MSVFLIIAIPMLCVAVTLLCLARVKKNKKFLIPGFVLLSAGFVNAIIGLSAG
ncbi:hypothetical protein MXM41_02515 [Leclercia adecarboxylata]|uniref:hypothetical protein n=1 Tax=Leclercia adecarboxylata TaxID=83655 RepID=UPI002DB8EBF6|nr:hypothetical protein [Leclercia adecarboxylata]MEB6377818.1 hypothetical protein [Leclercia adecarboxylata]